MPLNKSARLDEILKGYDKLIVAFSGGVDSTYLLHRAHKVKGSDIMAVTIRTPYIPAREIEESVSFTKKHAINHMILDLPFPDEIRHNPNDRCYLCKRTLFTELALFARENRYSHVADGTNSDDLNDYRPGMKALRELDIRSPLMEAGMTKNDIRELSRRDGLAIWDKPALACLLTRIPYNTTVSTDMLGMIEKAELILLERGYPGARVRLHGDIARIECIPGYMEKIIRTSEREYITGKLRAIGFRYVSLDLEGYKTGSLNPW